MKSSGKRVRNGLILPYLVKNWRQVIADFTYNNVGWGVRDTVKGYGQISQLLKRKLYAANGVKTGSMMWWPKINRICYLWKNWHTQYEKKFGSLLTTYMYGKSITHKPNNISSCNRVIPNIKKTQNQTKKTHPTKQTEEGSSLVLCPLWKYFTLLCTSLQCFFLTVLLQKHSPPNKKKQKKGGGGKERK